MNVSRKEQPFVFFIFGIFLAIFAVGLFAGFRSPTVTQDIITLHPAVTAVYEAAGPWGVLAIPTVLALSLIAWGVYRILDDWAAFAAPPTLSEGQLNQALMTALEFGPEDLAENQNGRVSPAQQQKLEKMYRQGVGMAGCGTAFMLVFLLFIAGFVWFSPDGTGLRQVVEAMPVLGLVYGGIFAFMLFMTINGFIQYTLRTKELPTQQVQTIEGLVRLSKTRSRYGTVCALRVGRKNFYTTEPQLNGFWHGGRYRVYYLRYRPVPVLLSAEWLQQSVNSKQ